MNLSSAMRTLRDLEATVVLALILCSAAPASRAQLSDAERWAVQVEDQYDIYPNITYHIANNYEAKLDVYSRESVKTPAPVVMLIHGGGWVSGAKEEAILGALPYLHMGFAVVNVEYRLARISPAPAAVEDCLCALHWIGRNAKKYNFDLKKVIVTGGSAGGHLALTTAMIPFSAGFENECAADDDDAWKGPWADPRPEVAAVINWLGITDVADLLQGPNLRSYAIAWLGGQPNREDLARRLSPLAYVRAGTPPVLTVHGDADQVVPYSNAARLHAALTKAGVKNQLVTIHGGDHGDFTAAQQIMAFEAIVSFLASLGITPVTKP
jgi:acetyl esterase/lipase